MVTHTYNSGTEEAEPGGSPQFWGQPGLQSELKGSLHYIARKKNEEKTQKKKKKEENFRSTSMVLTSCTENPQLMSESILGECSWMGCDHNLTDSAHLWESAARRFINVDLMNF